MSGKFHLEKSDTFFDGIAFTLRSATAVSVFIWYKSDNGFLD